MKQYWMSLQPRERLTLMTGAAIAALLLLYLLLIEPFMVELERLESSVAAQQEELAWMQAAAKEVAQLKRQNGGGASVAQRGERSLLSLVDSSAREEGLAEPLKQLSPVGEKVRVRLEGAAFDALLRWLDRLEQDFAVGVDSLTLERLDAPGLVNATVVVKDGGAE
ncbi:MAG: type II secretion system protein GspM [Pseudomonadota bacterium]